VWEDTEKRVGTELTQMQECVYDCIEKNGEGFVMRWPSLVEKSADIRDGNGGGGDDDDCVRTPQMLLYYSGYHCYWRVVTLREVEI
jgi:hypothetical protein